MAGKLAKEIQQTKPFASLEEEALLNLGRTYEQLQQRVGEVMRQYQISSTQYNMLRILRGAGSEGLTCSQASERMVTLDPDVTRLLDRLEARSLIRRDRSKEDRRVVVTQITPEGLELLGTLQAPLCGALHQNLGHLGEAKLRQLIDLLEELRERTP